MKPLKVLVYETKVSAAKANDLNSVPSTLIGTIMRQQTFFAIVISDLDGSLDAVPFNSVEVLPNQFDTEAVISIDVPGAINIAMDN